MKGFLGLGKIMGIKIELHWTFILLLGWVGLEEYQFSQDLQRVLISQGFIIVLMFCVVLHELGHSLMARRYNVSTKSIILLPIGGVSTLDKLPEKPSEELLIALAGPAVSLLLAILLGLLIPLQSYLNFDSIFLEQQLYQPSLLNFLFYLFMANVMLVVFNLIPAFPMDGGRVLRAILAFKLGRVRATKIAASIGQALSVAFFILGILFNPFLVLIAFFIFIAAFSESQMIQQAELLQGHIVKEATMTHITTLNPHQSVQDVIKIILDGSEKDFVVIEHGEIIGVVTQKDILKNAKSSSLLVKDIMQKNFKTVDVSTEISKVLELIGQEKKSFFPVVEKNQLIGIIDNINISEFILLLSSKELKTAV